MNKNDNDILLPLAGVLWTIVMLGEGALGSPELLSFGFVYVFIYISSRSSTSKEVHFVKRWLSYISITGTAFWMISSGGITAGSPLAAVYFYSLPVTALFFSIVINMLLNREK
ncbi:hypothetical protein [Idiomarina ramblicola]|uniref:hypothetical protein n=1 Tax=Idiomarina ramblicola TaxID=263724 RepID=UPI000F899AC6|nr:hypothetical protein [Idiomarina ramblicola]